MMLFDVHTHLDFDDFEGDRSHVLERACDMLIVNSIVKIENFPWFNHLAQVRENLFISVGQSPSELSWELFDATSKIIIENKDDILAIGEVGLDHYWIKDENERDTQREIFKRYIELSKRLDLPLVLHTRDAEKETLDIVEEFGISALMHCFSGSEELAKRAIDLGCLISIPTNVTFVKSRQNLVKKVGLENIVLETDAPYLAPTRGDRNEPANIRFAAEKISGVLGISFAEVCEATFESSCEFYGVKLP